MLWFSLRSNEKWAQQQVATGNLYTFPGSAEHCAELAEPDALKKWSVYKCVCVYMCVYKTRVCKAIWLSSLLHLLNLIKHPSNSLARLRTPITHTYVLIHSLPGSDMDLKDLQHSFMDCRVRNATCCMNHCLFECLFPWMPSSSCDASRKPALQTLQQTIVASRNFQETGTWNSLTSATSYIFPSRF